MVSACTVAGLGVGVGLHEAGRVMTEASGYAEPIRRDYDTAIALRERTRRDLAAARARVELLESSSKTADWSRLLGYLAMVAEDRCVFREVEVRVPEDLSAESPARLTATIRGEALSRRALMSMVSALEDGGVFQEVRLSRFSENGGAFDLRLVIDRSEKSEGGA